MPNNGAKTIKYIEAAAEIGRRADSWSQISQSFSRQDPFASQTSRLNLIPLPIPFLGL